MRIVSGELKGRRVTSAVPSGVRPTADSVRESIFNILSNIIDIEDSKVLDICAGTGFMGFEAISRGAAHCTFIEKQAKVSAFIRSNADILHIDKSRFELITSDAVKAIKALSTDSECRFDIVFFDPPYQAGITNQVIEALAVSPCLQSETIIAAEHSSLHKVIQPENWELLTTRKFGEIMVEIFRVL